MRIIDGAHGPLRNQLVDIVLARMAVRCDTGFGRLATQVYLRRVDEATVVQVAVDHGLRRNHSLVD